MNGFSGEVSSALSGRNRMCRGVRGFAAHSRLLTSRLISSRAFGAPEACRRHSDSSSRAERFQLPGSELASYLALRADALACMCKRSAHVRAWSQARSCASKSVMIESSL